MGLVRYVHRKELDGSTAGEWLLDGQGLMISRSDRRWRITPSLWIDTQHTCEQDVACWLEQRWEWLVRHGLNQAEFRRLRDARDAALHALAHEPLPPYTGATR